MNVSTLERSPAIRFCKFNHGEKRLRSDGRWVCPVCEANRKRQSDEKRKEEAKPVVEWRLYQLPRHLAHLRGLPAVKEIVRAFYGIHLHAPTIVLCAAANVCVYEDVTVRTPKRGEPKPEETTFFVR